MEQNFTPGLVLIGLSGTVARMKGNSKCTSGNSLSQAGVQKKDIGAASQTLLTTFL